MLCTKCGKNNAEIYYKQTINGHTEEYALCSECAEKLKKEGKIGYMSPLTFKGFGDFGYGGLFGDNLFGLPVVKKTGKAATVKKCTLCSSTFDDIARRGRAGCAECYKVFGDELTPSIEKIHGKGVYAGKKPSKINLKRDGKADELMQLKAELEAAIKAQEFENAAVLRDKIRGLENDGQEG